MILEDVLVPGKRLRCDVCMEEWISISYRLPDCCPNRFCRSREWNGVKQRRKPDRGPTIELPKPRRMKQDDENETF